MRPEEVAQSQELSNLMNGGGRLSPLHCLELVCSRLHPFFGEPKTKVRHVLASENTLA